MLAKLKQFAGIKSATTAPATTPTKNDPAKKKKALTVILPIKRDIIENLIKNTNSHQKRDTIIIELVDQLMIYSYQKRASDIHIEPIVGSKSLIRLRIDGILEDEFVLDFAAHERIIARLKVMTDMRSDEHRAPQDGRFAFVAGEERIDVRASIIPVIYGEKAVMRLLSGSSHNLTLADLGLGEADLARLQKQIDKPWGMILSTGPTGSGKTTSIYAILAQLNQRDVNIATIEDPVEFKIQGINQSQVDHAAKFTFANGLRSLLRQDPDIIMVGEIRDTETAKIAINAALTGHQLLSTLHTNDAATTMPRLIDMEVEPYLVASTLNVAIAQRLMRRLCDDCRGTKSLAKSDAVKYLSPEILDLLFGKKTSVKVPEAKGCQSCNMSGYKGRIGIFEVLTNSPAIQDLILRRANSDEIRKQAISEGMKTLQADGVEKIQKGLSTVDEFMRVVHE